MKWHTCNICGYVEPVARVGHRLRKLLAHKEAHTQAEKDRACRRSPAGGRSKVRRATGRRVPLLSRICQSPTCGKTFEISGGRIKAGSGKYCSVKCVGDAQRGHRRNFQRAVRAYPDAVQPA